MIRGPTLTLAAHTTDTRVSRIARDLSRDLASIGIEARDAGGEAVPGERGDPLVLGQLALGLITSGAVTALIGCLKAYITREPTLTVRIKRSDGTEVEVNAKNLDDSASERALRDALQKS